MTDITQRSHPNSGTYPEFTSLSELILVEDLAKRLGTTRSAFMNARYDAPGLPFIRLGKRIYIAETQFVWWLNQKQRRIPDKYWMDRKRRISEGALLTRNEKGDFAKKKEKR